MTRILVIEDEAHKFSADAIARLRNAVAIHEGESVMTGTYHNRRCMIAGLAVAAMAAAMGAFDKVKAAAIDGKDAISAFCSMDAGPTFGQRYGANPRSTGNGGMGRGAVMRSKRASKRMRNIRKHTKAAHRGSR